MSSSSSFSQGQSQHQQPWLLYQQQQFMMPPVQPMMPQGQAMMSQSQLPMMPPAQVMMPRNQGMGYHSRQQQRLRDQSMVGPMDGSYGYALPDPSMMGHNAYAVGKFSELLFVDNEPAGLSVVEAATSPQFSVQLELKLQYGL
jgi:hypothetical protein